ncbi:MAG TPA: CAP domain-containing protein [Nocardioidaceae bacterium]|nr:CAP domain-containing protein [Nocardioidaceae bacterium]
MVALTVSGVTFAVHGAQEAITSLDESRLTASPSAAADVEERPARTARPSRTAPTPRFVLREESGGKAEDKPRPSRKSEPRPGKTPSKTPSKTPESPTPSRTQVQTPSISEPTPAEPTAPTVKTVRSDSPILRATNAARANAGLRALSVNACLARLAQQHAERLAAEQTLYHQDLGTVSSTCGTSTAGENVAMNHSGPSAMVGQWLDSPGHRANLLNSDFTLIGIGTARAGDGAWYGVQVFGAK